MKLHAIDEFLSVRSRWWLILASFVLVGLLGAMDQITGFEISFAVFYLIPIAFAAWYIGSTVSLVVSIVAASTWLAVDYTSGHTYNQAWIPVWNAFTRLVFFVVIADLLSTLRDSLNAQMLQLREDTLTGVRSLRAFEEEASLILKSAARHQHPVSIGFIDLDGFKSLNDSMGHAVGDEALKATGAQLNSSCRSSDIVARIGGDEFAVLLPHTDKIGAVALFSKIQTQLLQTMKDKGWHIGFSIGVAVFPNGQANLKQALDHADALMYTVKQGSKNAVLYRVFPSIDRKARKAIRGDALKDT